MPTNDFQVFAGGGSANVISQAQYLALQSLSTGFQTGIAQSNQVNKVWRQSSIIAAMIAQFICDNSGQNALDDGTIATLEANFITALQKVGRNKLTSTLSLFVSPSGSDSNTGLTSGQPFQTIQQAVNVALNNYDTQGNTVTINLANGTYTAGMRMAWPMEGGGILQIIGNPSSPSSVVISTTNAHVFWVTAGIVNLSGMTLAATGNASGVQASTIICGSGSNVNLSGTMVFAACTGQHLWASNAGIIGTGSNYSITGGANAHYYASTAGQILGPNAAQTITLTGSPAFTDFANANNCGVIQITSTATTFSGAATGQRYLALGNGVINTAGAAQTYFPGSVAGTTPSGGQYI